MQFDDNDKHDNSSDLLRPTRGVSAPILLSIFTFTSASLGAWLALDTFGVKNAGRIGVLIGFVSAGIFWLAYLKTWFASVRASFIPVVDAIINHDIDGDGEVGEPASGGVIRFDLPNISDDGAYSVQRVAFPNWVDKNKLSALAAHVVGGGNFSEPQVVRKKKIYTPSEFIKMRTLLLDKKLIEWKDYQNERLGTEWSDSGLDFLERIDEQGIG